MATAQKAAHSKSPAGNLFGRSNYIGMLAGAALVTIGFLLMAGGKSADPTKFNDNEVYSATRITLAPILIMAGFIVEIFAIMKQPKNADNA